MSRRDPRLRDLARANRTRFTYDEVRLWVELRRGRLGVRFRRQEPIGPYIVDFVCLRRKLIVEADGATHLDERTAEADLLRDRYLVARGFKVLHFPSYMIQDFTSEVLDIISQYLQRDEPGSLYFK